MNRKAKDDANGSDNAKVVGLPSDGVNRRAERLAAELRSNLKKRKDLERARSRVDRDRQD